MSLIRSGLFALALSATLSSTHASAQSDYLSFGAISYSPATEQVGASWGQASRWDAQVLSDYYCVAADCAPVVWVQGGCGAIAKSPDSETVTYGIHVRRDVAEANAMDACTTQHLTACRLLAWVCSN